MPARVVSAERRSGTTFEVDDDLFWIEHILDAARHALEDTRSAPPESETAALAPGLERLCGELEAQLDAAREGTAGAENP